MRTLQGLLSNILALVASGFSGSGRVAIGVALVAFATALAMTIKFPPKEPKR